MLGFAVFLAMIQASSLRKKSLALHRIGGDAYTILSLATTVVFVVGWFQGQFSSPLWLFQGLLLLTWTGKVREVGRYVSVAKIYSISRHERLGRQVFYMNFMIAMLYLLLARLL